MKILSFAFLAAFAATALVGTQASANLLANPSFEQPITQDGPPFVGLWEGFNGGAGSSAANGTASPRTGAMELDLRIDGVNNTFAGAFQDVPGLVPGTPVVSVAGTERARIPSISASNFASNGGTRFPIPKLRVRQISPMHRAQTTFSLICRPSCQAESIRLAWCMRFRPSAANLDLPIPGSSTWTICPSGCLNRRPRCWSAWPPQGLCSLVAAVRNLLQS
jgi:hypothetical protein